MAQLLVLGDSQVERVWNHVRGDREQLKSGLFFAVKSRAHLFSGFKSMKPGVSASCCKGSNVGLCRDFLWGLIFCHFH